MEDSIRHALTSGLTCDITTTGRTSGQPRRIEIWYFSINDQIYITGTPGIRDWYANMLAQPQFIFHVKEGARADLPARAVAITDPAERQRIMGLIMASNSYFAGTDLDTWVAASPLVRVDFD